MTSYRAGVDVQAQLPLLATYLGHARYSDTAYYISGTAELLGLAAERAFILKGVCDEIEVDTRWTPGVIL